MDEHDRLTDIEVDAVGLVFKPAHKRKFFFLKSQNHGGGEGMSDKYEGVLQELEAVEEVNQTAWDKALGFMRELYSQLSGGNSEPDPVVPEPDGEPEGYAEALDAATKAVEEKFSAQLAEETRKREEFAAAYAAERQARRLVELEGVIASDFNQLATGEGFAETLLALSDHSEELYEKFHTVLKAANEMVKTSGVYEQQSRAGAPSTDPFESAVEKVRQEKFSTEEYSIGWVHAMEVVMDSNPELAVGYSLAGGN